MFLVFLSSGLYYLSGVRYSDGFKLSQHGNEAQIEYNHGA